MRFLLAALRHGVASLATVGLFTGLCVAAYFGLLLIAVLFDLGLGSPVAGVVWPAATAFLTLGAVVLVLLPISAVAERICSARRWSFLVQIPVSTLLLFPTVLGLLFLGSGPTGWPGSEALVATAAWFSLALAVPLGVYWWSLKATELALALPVFVARRACRWGEVANRSVEADSYSEALDLHLGPGATKEIR